MKNPQTTPSLLATRGPRRLIALLATGLFIGCATLPAKLPGSVATTATSSSMAQRVGSLGPGLQFLNPAVPDNAVTPETGAIYSYARVYSANPRSSPVGIELWVFAADGAPLHGRHEAYLRDLYKEIYGWSPAAWESLLAGVPERAQVLREKSDFFWETLAQHVAERVLNEPHTPALYRLGPACRAKSAKTCKDAGIREADRVVIRTLLDARRDPMNPVTRSITYEVRRGHLADPELLFELQVPNGLAVAGPHQETLDFRPKIAGDPGALGDIRLWAHLPRGRRARTVNAHYPDYNLLFVPLRHLVMQRHVEDPKRPASGADYPSRTALVEAVRSLISELRTPSGGAQVAAKLGPFLTSKYYYMFEGGQGLASYRSYILGEAAGVARGLSPDFGLVELTLDGEVVASFPEPTRSP